MSWRIKEVTDPYQFEPLGCPPEPDPVGAEFIKFISCIVLACKNLSVDVEW